MHRTFAAGGIALSVTGCATVSVPVETFRPQVERHVAAIQARNMKEIVATVTSGDHLLLILPSGKTSQTRAEYMDFHRALFASEHWAMTFEPLSFQVFGGYGHALYRVTFDGDGAGPSAANPALLSLGFRLERDEWRLVHDQNTPVAN